MKRIKRNGERGTFRALIEVKQGAAKDLSERFRLGRHFDVSRILETWKFRQE
jgi:hypothetical protein